MLNDTELSDIYKKYKDDPLIMKLLEGYINIAVSDGYMEEEIKRIGETQLAIRRLSSYGR